MNGLRLLLASLTLMSCSGNVVQNASSTSGGGGAAGGPVGVGAAVGTGGAMSVSTGTAVSASTSTSSAPSTGAGGGGCVSTIQLVADNGAPVTLTSFCAGFPYDPGGVNEPIGYMVEGGPPPGVSYLRVLGCASEMPDAEGIQLLMYNVSGPGTSTLGGAMYTDPMGTTSNISNDPKFDVTVTALGPVGQPIEGTFLVTTQTSGPAIILHTLSGSFHVCHVQDQNVP